MAFTACVRLPILSLSELQMYDNLFGCLTNLLIFRLANVAVRMAASERDEHNEHNEIHRSSLADRVAHSPIKADHLLENSKSSEIQSVGIPVWTQRLSLRKPLSA